jgi:hypothetical protein
MKKQADKREQQVGKREKPADKIMERPVARPLYSQIR